MGDSRRFYDLPGDVEKDFSPLSLFLMELGSQAHPSGAYAVRNIKGNKRQNLIDSYRIGSETGAVPSTVNPRSLFFDLERAPTPMESRYAQMGADEVSDLNRVAEAKLRQQQLAEYAEALKIGREYGPDAASPYGVDLSSVYGPDYIPSYKQDEGKYRSTQANAVASNLRTLGPRSRVMVENGSFPSTEYTLNTPGFFNTPGLVDKTRADIARANSDSKAKNLAREVNQVAKVYLNRIDNYYSILEELRGVMNEKKQSNTGADFKTVDEASDNLYRIATRKGGYETLTPEQKKFLNIHAMLNITLKTAQEDVGIKPRDGEDKPMGARQGIPAIDLLLQTRPELEQGMDFMNPEVNPYILPFLQESFADEQRQLGLNRQEAWNYQPAFNTIGSRSGQVFPSFGAERPPLVPPGVDLSNNAYVPSEEPQGYDINAVRASLLGVLAEE